MTHKTPPEGQDANPSRTHRTSTHKGESAAEDVRPAKGARSGAVPKGRGEDPSFDDDPTEDMEVTTEPPTDIDEPTRGKGRKATPKERGPAKATAKEDYSGIPAEYRGAAKQLFDQGFSLLQVLALILTFGASLPGLVDQLIEMHTTSEQAEPLPPATLSECSYHLRQALRIAHA